MTPFSYLTRPAHCLSVTTSMATNQLALRILNSNYFLNVVLCVCLGFDTVFGWQSDQQLNTTHRVLPTIKRLSQYRFICIYVFIYVSVSAHRETRFVRINSGPNSMAHTTEDKTHNNGSLGFETASSMLGSDHLPRVPTCWQEAERPERRDGFEVRLLPSSVWAEDGMLSTGPRKYIRDFVLHLLFLHASIYIYS